MNLLEKLQKITLRVEPVEGTTLGDGVYVREITGQVMDDAVRALKRARADGGRADTGGKSDPGNDGDPDYVGLGRVEIVAICLCDAAGEPHLDVADPQHLELIGKLDNRSLQKLFERAADLNGFTSPPKGEGR